MRILKRSYEETSLEYNVSVGLITRLMKAYNDDDTLIDDIRHKELRAIQL